jgi:DNA processing protein
MEALGSADAVLGASARALCEVEGVGPATAEEILKAADADPRPEMELADRHGVRILGQGDSSYPAALRNTFDPPIVLYVKGELRHSDAIALAVVGTRRPSHYGRAQAERFSSSLARAGFTIVSGLARGVDSAAHRGALAARGRTVAVLGSGLANIYPAENRDLAAEVAGHGAVVSEFPMTTAPSRENFPRRNRLIAGLGLGTLVVEAPLKSGSLITARLANDLGREVFAMPGRIDQRNAQGGNTLIGRGQAKLVQSLEDVLEELGPVADALRPPAAREAAAAADPPESAQQRLTEPPPVAGPSGPAAATAAAPVGTAEPEAAGQAGPESAVLGVLSEEELHIDEVCARTGLPAHEVSATLMMLELKRRVRQLPGRFFVRHEY